MCSAWLYISAKNCDSRRRTTCRSYGICQWNSGQIGQFWGGIHQVFHGHGDFAGTRIGIFGRIYDNIGAVITGVDGDLAGEGGTGAKRQKDYGKCASVIHFAK